MNRRLFISTKESYIPKCNLPVTGANWIQEEGFRVLIESSSSLEKVDMGFIAVSTGEEANWFCKAIFATLDDHRDLVIDFNKKKIYTTDTSLLEFCMVSEVMEPIDPLEQIRDISRNSIQDLKLEEIEEVK